MQSDYQGLAGFRSNLLKIPKVFGSFLGTSAESREDVRGTPAPVPVRLWGRCRPCFAEAIDNGSRLLPRVCPRRRRSAWAGGWAAAGTGEEPLRWQQVLRAALCRLAREGLVLATGCSPTGPRTPTAPRRVRNSSLRAGWGVLPRSRTARSLATARCHQGKEGGCWRPGQSEGSGDMNTTNRSVSGFAGAEESPSWSRSWSFTAAESWGWCKTGRARNGANQHGCTSVGPGKALRGVRDTWPPTELSRRPCLGCLQAKLEAAPGAARSVRAAGGGTEQRHVHWTRLLPKSSRYCPLLSGAANQHVPRLLHPESRSSKADPVL